jgi:cellulose biosynthesis protein BcsQ
MKSIAFFNNKGGVGKTTLVCNIASYFGDKLGKRVLVVDADPQCNATVYTMCVETVTQIYSQAYPTNTIYSLLQPIRRSSGYLELSQLSISHSEGFNIDMLLGDTKLALAEDLLSEDWIKVESGMPRGLHTTFVFKDFLEKIRNDYDYVFFDLGPSLGAINRAVLLACDYFIVPMSSDIFSIKAIDNISTSLKSWTDSLTQGLNNYLKKEGETYVIGSKELKDVYTRFLGYVTQQYVSRAKEGEKKPVKAYEDILKKVPSRINTKFSDFYPQSIDKSKLLLSQIPNYNSLVPLSQTANKAIFSLTGIDGVVGAHFMKVKQYEDLMNKICLSIIENIKTYEMA